MVKLHELSAAVPTDITPSGNEFFAGERLHHGIKPVEVRSTHIGWLPPEVRIIDPIGIYAVTILRAVNGLPLKGNVTVLSPPRAHGLRSPLWIRLTPQPSRLARTLFTPRGSPLPPLLVSVVIFQRLLNAAFAALPFFQNAPPRALSTG